MGLPALAKIPTNQFLTPQSQEWLSLPGLVLGGLGWSLNSAMAGCVVSDYSLSLSEHQFLPRLEGEISPGHPIYAGGCEDAL